MRIINLVQVQAIEQRLLEQVRILLKVKKELEFVFVHVMEVCQDDRTLHCLKEAMEELEAEIHTHRMMQSCLQEIRDEYANTEHKIVEVYDLERVVYPRPEFGRSVISGLDGLSGLLPF